MAQYIRLRNIGGSNTSLSSAGSSVDLEKGYSRLHSGVGRSRIPIKPSTGVGVAAGQQYQHIFEGHLGSAASDPNNPVAKWFYNLFYGKKADVADQGKTGLTLPFSNNIGPGNRIGPAETGADAIAQGHDLHYQEAKKDSDVLSADKEAISHFVHEAINSKNPISQAQAAVGAIGLGIKHGVEKAAGKVFYGNPEPQEHEEHPSFEDALAEGEQGEGEEVDEDLFEEMQSEPVASTSGTGKGQGLKRKPGKGLKRQRTEGSDRMRADSSGYSLPGTAGGQGQTDQSLGNAETERGQSLCQPWTYINSHIRYYRKLHRFFTYGISFQILNGPSTPPTGNSEFVITTPLANVPWDCLFMYLNKGEYNQLPFGSWVNKCKVKIVPRNVRIAFPTNSSGTELATLNQNKNTLYAIGLNKNHDIQNVTYTGFASGKPMVPTSVQFFEDSDHTSLLQAMYGTGTAADWVSPGLIPYHQLGIPMNLPNYANIIYRAQTSSVGVDGIQCLQEHVKCLDADIASGGCLIEEEYEPTMGMITQPPVGVSHLWFNGQTYHIPRTSRINDAQTQTVQVQNNQILSTADSTTSTYNVTSTWPYTDTSQIIDKSQWLYHGIYSKGGVQTQPSIHIGTRPVNAITTNSLVANETDNTNFTDTNCEWEVECLIEINTQYPCERPFAFNWNPNVNGSTFWEICNPNQGDYGQVMMAGLRTY